MIKYNKNQRNKLFLMPRDRPQAHVIYQCAICRFYQLPMQRWKKGQAFLCQTFEKAIYI